MGIGVSENEIQEWATSLGCGSGLLQFTYLGLPVGASMRKPHHWAVVIDKMKNKLAMWKAKLLSIGGRRTLVKAVLGSISLYFFSLFRALVSVLKLLEGVRSNLFWGGEGCDRERTKRHIHWVNWGKVVAPFAKGCLNIGGIRDLNWGLVGKW